MYALFGFSGRRWAHDTKEGYGTQRRGLNFPPPCRPSLSCGISWVRGSSVQWGYNAAAGLAVVGITLRTSRSKRERTIGGAPGLFQSLGQTTLKFSCQTCTIAAYSGRSNRI